VEHSKPHAHVMMTQMSVKARIKISKVDLMKELQQLHKRETMVPKKKNEFTCKDRQKGLGYLMFIKEKIVVTVKARGCVDIIPQQEYTKRGQ